MGKKNGCSQIPQSAEQIISSKNNHFSIDWPWDGVGVQVCLYQVQFYIFVIIKTCQKCQPKAWIYRENTNPVSF